MLRKAVPQATRGETVATLMEAYLDLGQPDRANEVINLAPFKARAGVELLVARARLSAERGRPSAAEGFAQEALARLRGPRASRALKAEVYTVLGRAQYDQKTWKASLRSNKMATDLDPRSARAWYQLGLSAEALKQLPLAKQALETSVKNDAMGPGQQERGGEAWYHLGKVRTALGDPSANEAYQKYLEVTPKGPLADEVRQILKGGPPPAPPAKPTSSPPRNRRRGR